jgi:hypothetical protein
MNVITANRLDDGLVVFLDADRRWTTVFAAAIRLDAAETETALEVARESVRRQEVLDPYSVATIETADGIAPKEIRERIRAFGPTIASNFPDQVRPRKAAE